MKQRIINFLLRNLLNAIVLEDVVTTNSAKILQIGGLDISEQDRKQLRIEADYILQTKLWSLLENTLKHQAHEKIFIKSVDFTDCFSGKLMLYNLDVQKTIIKKLSGK